MKRIIILEKVGDVFRQYWMLPELDYPELPSLLDKIIEKLISLGYIKPAIYDTYSQVRVIPWIWDEGIYNHEEGANSKYLPASKVFPFPRFNIKSELEFDQYNHWLVTEFKHTVMKLNNSIHLEPGWEDIKSDYVFELNPIKVEVTQEDIDRLEVFFTMTKEGSDCC